MNGSQDPTRPSPPPRPAWDFDYRPIRFPEETPSAQECDFVLATSHALPLEAIAAAVTGLDPVSHVTDLVHVGPVHWVRIVTRAPVPLVRLSQALETAGLAVRYVASALRADLRLPVRLGDAPGWLPDRRGWATRAPSDGPETPLPGGWFLAEPGGVGADRRLCGTGAGTRLAVIDDDAMQADRLDLDAELLVNLPRAPRAQAHGPLMVAWAVGTGQGPGCFRGVAPDASPRLYIIPKPGVDVLSLPMAIAQAVEHGADVIVCATYVEGSASPMLDDALELARRFGRGGLGTAIIMPTGRETSSPTGSLHASLSLGLGDPASDPRVDCIAPGGAKGGWFLWRDRAGLLRPFANRGPAVRWSAPGDDLAHPFGRAGQWCHAESSGASAVAAGVMLLVLAANPGLRASELDKALSLSVRQYDPAADAAAGRLADRQDVLPPGRDPDGHNARHGYGHLCAWRACAAVSDPVCAALLAIGEDTAARTYGLARRIPSSVPDAYSEEVGRTAASAVLSDGRAMHALCTLLRHLRLVAHRPERRDAHPPGALLRQVMLVVRLCAQTDQRQRGSCSALEASLHGIAQGPGAMIHQVEATIWEFANSMFEHSREDADDGHLRTAHAPFDSQALSA